MTMAATVNCTKGCCLKWICGVLGLISIITGCVLIRYKVLDTLIHDKIDENLALKEGSGARRNWESPPAPIYFQLWVLHVVNPSEVVKSGAKPILEERGPYTYREKREKVNITYEGGHRIISYQERKWYYYDRQMSVGRQADTFTTVNMPLLVIANLMRFESPSIKEIISIVLDNLKAHLFIDLTVGDLWGYEDMLLQKIKDALAKFGIKLPIDDKFSLLNKVNGSSDGVFRIKSGMGGTIDQLAEIISWNGSSSLSYWSSAIANMLNGSDGTLYPPFVDKSKPRFLFSTDFCRSLQIQYTQGYGLKGIDVDRFVVPPMTFANVSVNPFNIGFCTPYTDCLPAGLLNVSVCRDGAPLILSLPHFLDGDPGLCHRVVGMKPSRKEHQSVFDIEPMTGLVMNAAKRLQINAYLTNSSLKETANLSDYIVMPILWLNESATIDDKSASDFRKERDKIMVAMKVADIAEYGLIIFGAFLLLCSIASLFKQVLGFSRKRKMELHGEKKPILPSASKTVSPPAFKTCCR